MKQSSFKITHIFKSFRINRKYKDRLFRYIFKEKEDLLSLYNAVNGTSYSNVNDLTVTTLLDVVYLRMKNDVGFLIGSSLNLYEHQSTWNPNMPLRGLLYFADMIRAYAERNHLNLYSSKQIDLPFPKYVIFYNGDADAPDRTELLLSDSFKEDTDGLPHSGRKESPALECRATLLNINYGHNAEIMKNCRRLSDYAYFVNLVKQHLSSGLTAQEAIDLAAEECIQAGILADILTVNRAEVKNMLLTTFNEREYKKMVRQEAKEEGLEEGRKEGLEEGRKEGRKEGREEGRKEGREEGWKEGIEKGRKEGMEKGIQEGIQTGIQEGIQKGIQEGIQKGTQDMIIQLYKQNISVSVIAKAARISEEETERIVQESCCSPTKTPEVDNRRNVQSDKEKSIREK